MLGGLGAMCLSSASPHVCMYAITAQTCHSKHVCMQTWQPGLGVFPLGVGHVLGVRMELQVCQGPLMYAG